MNLYIKVDGVTHNGTQRLLEALKKVDAQCTFNPPPEDGDVSEKGYFELHKVCLNGVINAVEVIAKGENVCPLQEVVDIIRYYAKKEFMEKEEVSKEIMRILGISWTNISEILGSVRFVASYSQERQLTSLFGCLERDLTDKYEEIPF